jgi:hypothetical protein
MIGILLFLLSDCRKCSACKRPRTKTNKETKYRLPASSWLPIWCCGSRDMDRVAARKGKTGTVGCHHAEGGAYTSGLDVFQHQRKRAELLYHQDAGYNVCSGRYIEVTAPTRQIRRLTINHVYLLNHVADRIIFSSMFDSSE